MAPPRGRTAIIQAVNTPLAFFVLVILIVEAILGVVAFNLEAGADRTFVIRGMIVLIFVLVIIVAYFTYKGPSSLAGQDRQRTSKYSLLIGPPEKPERFKNLDVTVIDWDDQCFLLSPSVNVKEQITLVPSRVGPTIRAEIPPSVVEKVRDEAVWLDLKDRNGNRWKVQSFYLFENLLPLSVVENESKIIQDYGEEDQ